MYISAQRLIEFVEKEINFCKEVNEMEGYVEISDHQMVIDKRLVAELDKLLERFLRESEDHRCALGDLGARSRKHFEALKSILDKCR